MVKKKTSVRTPKKVMHKFRPGCSKRASPVKEEKKQKSAKGQKKTIFEVASRYAGTLAFFTILGPSIDFAIRANKVSPNFAVDTHSSNAVAVSRLLFEPLPFAVGMALALADLVPAETLAIGAAAKVGGVRPFES